MASYSSPTAGLTTLGWQQHQQAELPEDVLLQVFSLLPFPFVLQARLVCKKWLALLSSSDFARLWSSRLQIMSGNTSADVWLLGDGERSLLFSASSTYSDDDLQVVDDAVQYADQLRRGGGGPDRALSTTPYTGLSYPLPAAPAYRCAASSLGVILLRSTAVRSGEMYWRSSGHLQVASRPFFLLLNPVTKCQIRLPCHRHILDISFMGMHTTDLSFTSFYLISCGSAPWEYLPAHCRSSRAPNADYVRSSWGQGLGEEVVVEFYDSAIGSWRLLPRPPRPSRGLIFPRCDFVWWSGRFCTVTSEEVLTYDVQRDCWDSLKLPTSLSPSSSTLHALNGCLFMESSMWLFQGDTQTRMLRFGISEFDPVSARWLEVIFMPDACAHHIVRQQGHSESLHPKYMYNSFSDTESYQILFTPKNVENLRGEIQIVAVVYHVISRSWTLGSFLNNELAAEYSRTVRLQEDLKAFTFKPSFTRLSLSSVSEATCR